MRDCDLHWFEHTESRGRRHVQVTRFIVYRGDPGCPDIVAQCPTKDAMQAALRLLRVGGPTV